MARCHLQGPTIYRGGRHSLELPAWEDHMASDTTFSAVVPTVSLSENTGGTPPASTAQERQQTVRLPAALDMRDLVALIELIEIGRAHV